MPNITEENGMSIFKSGDLRTAEERVRAELLHNWCNENKTAWFKFITKCKFCQKYCQEFEWKALNHFQFIFEPCVLYDVGHSTLTDTDPEQFPLSSDLYIIYIYIIWSKYSLWCALWIQVSAYQLCSDSSSYG